MKKTILFIGIVVAVIMTFSYFSFAGLINYERRNRAAVRKAAQENQESEDALLPLWMKGEPKVTGTRDKRYDINRDGILQTAETKILLRDVVDEVKDKGGITVDCDVLKEYDKNKDGVITKFEAETISKDASPQQ